MSFVTTIRLTEDERRFIEENCISLTKFVRNNLKKLQEAHSLPNQASDQSPGELI